MSREVEDRLQRAGRTDESCQHLTRALPSVASEGNPLPQPNRASATYFPGYWLRICCRKQNASLKGEGRVLQLHRYPCEASSLLVRAVNPPILGWSVCRATTKAVAKCSSHGLRAVDPSDGADIHQVVRSRLRDTPEDGGATIRKYNPDIKGRL